MTFKRKLAHAALKVINRASDRIGITVAITKDIDRLLQVNAQNEMTAHWYRSALEMYAQGVATEPTLARRALEGRSDAAN